jgi:hypothetical protein
MHVGCDIAGCGITNAQPGDYCVARTGIDIATSGVIFAVVIDIDIPNK